MTTAFVLSGGGNLGAIQVGMLRSLFAANIRPDLIIGTSVGALNAGWIAGRGPDADIEELAQVWRKLRRGDIFPTNFIGGLRGFVGRSDHLVSASGLRQLLTRELTITRLEDARIPLHVVATNITSGHDHLISSGDAVDAICASAAIPGVFPAVTIDGRVLVDGGVVNNCPISHALSLGATEVWVLPCGYACALESAPRGALASALQAISLLIQQRLRTDAAQYASQIKLHIVPTLCPLKVSPTDFSQAERLIDDAAEISAAWLRDPRSLTIDESLGLHNHSH
jgi:NTE family protein